MGYLETKELKKYEIMFKKGFLSALKEFQTFCSWDLEDVTDEYLDQRWNAFTSDCRLAEDLFDEGVMGE